jgi:hypothetical protein
MGLRPPSSFVLFAVITSLFGLDFSSFGREDELFVLLSCLIFSNDVDASAYLKHKIIY